jgi:acyl-CoA thioester hydrolase
MHQRMKPSAKRSAEVELQVPFHDVDSVGIVWHGHYAKYFELARCALLDTFGYGYTQMVASGYIWPIIEFNLRYIKPARFEQKVRVRATLEEWEYRLKIAYVVTDAASGERLTKGHTLQVAVKKDTGEMLLASPPVLRERLGL